MSKEEEEALIAAEVKQQLEIIMANQQVHFANRLEKVMQDATDSLDQANAALQQERNAVQKTMDELRDELAKVEREGDKMAQAYFEGRQQQFVEAAKTELLRDLTRKHLLDAQKPSEIAKWLDVTMDFVQKIQQLLERLQPYSGGKPLRNTSGWPQKLRYSDYGRGGTIFYESPEGQFDMWWEFGGGKAVVIVDIPGAEHWEARTKLPLSKRSEVLQFIGEQVIADKMSSSTASFVIGDNVITFYAD